MAKIFDGWKSEKEVLSYFGAKSFSPYELVFAYKNNKSDDGDFVLFFKKGSEMSFIAGATDTADDHEVDNFKTYLVDVTLDDARSMFGKNPWYKKAKVDIESNFGVKESLQKFVNLLVEGADEPKFKKLEDLCKKHDKYYMMSDDHRVWTAGNAANNEIQHLAKELKKIDPERVEKILKIISF